MKYDAQLGEFKNKLNGASKILIVLPPNVNNDKMAGALALYLSLKQSNKDVAIVSEAEIRVSQSVLYGIGDVKSDLPEISSGNFVISLDGVVEDGKVPSLVDLNWYPEGTTLNLVLNVVPGMKFEPINISHHYDTGSFDLIIVIGAPTLAALGQVYNNNLEKFTDTPKINIDNSGSNNLFGVVNIVDQGVPVSQMVMNILQGMSLPQDADVATNIITGIYDVTRGLTNNVSAEAFLTIGEAMQMGGKIVRQTGERSSQPQAQGLDVKQFSGQPARDQRPQQPRTDGNKPLRSNDNRNQNRNQPQNQSFTPAQGKPGQNVSPKQNEPSQEEKPVGQVIQPFSEDLGSTAQRDTVATSAPQADDSQSQPQTSEPVEGEVVEEITPIDQEKAASSDEQKSQFETPTGEQATSPSPEGTNPAPDWLTPKIFSGKGLG